MADGPNPQRIFYDGKHLPKVFIAYPHKPTVYEQRSPPENAAGDPEIWRQFEEQVIAHEQAAEREVLHHETAVQRFADFLSSQSVAVAYDLLVRDTGTASIMRWCQHQIQDSGYLIIVVTPSLTQFLDGKCPSDKEPIFSSDYLYNLIHSSPQKVDGSRLEMIPLFLGIPKNADMVPVALRGASIYEVWDVEYREPLSEGMTSLLCRLTGQNRFTPPEPRAPIIIKPRPKRFGPKPMATVTQETAPAPSAPPPPYLLGNHHPLDIKALSRISEKSGFSQQWRSIAPHLGLTLAEIERCGGRGGGEESEACLQMLKLSVQRCNGGHLTPAILTVALEKSGCSFLYDTFNSVL